MPVAFGDGFALPCSVLYTKQNLTEEQKAQARENIEATRQDDTKVGTDTWSSKNIVDKLCPDFHESGSIVACEPVEGYPLTVQTDGATKVYRGGKNLIGFQPKTVNKNGITYTYKEDGTIVVDGTATSLSQTYICPVSFKEGVTYTLSGCVGGSNKTYQLFVEQGGVIGLYNANLPDTRAASGTGTTEVRIIVYAGQTVSNLVIKPQLEIGSIATEYEPYRTPDEFAPNEAIPALDGVNTIWADSGDVTVTGKADPKAVIQDLYNKLNALSTTMTALMGV